jgi:hypothetical protein
VRHIGKHVLDHYMTSKQARVSLYTLAHKVPKNMYVKRILNRERLPLHRSNNQAGRKGQDSALYSRPGMEEGGWNDMKGGKAMKNLNGTATLRLAALALALVLCLGEAVPSHAWNCTRGQNTLAAENVSPATVIVSAHAWCTNDYSGMCSSSRCDFDRTFSQNQGESCYCYCAEASDVAVHVTAKEQSTGKIICDIRTTLNKANHLKVDKRDGKLVCDFGDQHIYMQ